MFFAILPSIILAGFPDLEADAANKKRTLVVRFGQAAALKLAMGAVLIAEALRMVVLDSPPWLLVAILTQSTRLLFALIAFHRRPRLGRINGLLALALTYMFWFAWPP